MKVSVIVPVYNIEEYIERNLLSIKNQDFDDFECLIIDDGSKDKSIEIAQKIIKDDNRFFIYHKENGGLSDARNYGLQYVNSEYVMFIDGDDFVEKDFISTAYNYVKENDFDIVAFDYNQYYLKDNRKEIIHIPFENNKRYSLKDNKEILCYIGNSAWNKIYKTKLFKDNNITYPKGYIQEDLGTTPKLLFFAKSIGFINKPLYNYLIDRPNNISQERNERIYHIFDMCDSFINFYKENNIFEEYYEELKYLTIINVVWSLKKLPYYRDKTFVNKFVDDAFKYLKDNFSDFPKSKYSLYTNKEDKIYLNKYLLKAYLFYNNLK